MANNGVHTVRFGLFELDLRAGELRRNGAKVRLQEQPFQILTMLLEHPGEVVTREELRNKLWPADTFVDFDHGLNAAVKRLRDALGDSAESPRFVETVARRGYRFLPSVNGGTTPLSGTVGTKDRYLWLVAGLAVALFAVLAALNIGGVRGRLLGKKAAIRIESIAVLPLENLPGDPEQEYFADGMTDELITQLAKIGSLRVISRTSVMPFKSTRKPLARLPKI
jgi:DNA-binding winged helix-turn-helix (wHTH) protein